VTDHDRILIEALAVVRCQAGDEDAFEKLYELHSDGLLYYLRRLVGASGAAEDAAQQVWLTVYRKVKTLEEPRAFRTWLYRIAHNRAISALRKSGREISWEEVGGEDGTVLEEVHEEHFDTADAAQVHAGLERVSPPHREVLALRFLHEMSYREIADIAQVSVGTVRSRLHHAKNALRHQIELMNTPTLKGTRP